MEDGLKVIHEPTVISRDIPGRFNIRQASVVQGKRKDTTSSMLLQRR